MEMVERVARAISEDIDHRLPARTRQKWEDLTVLAKATMMARARVAIEAMRKPTNAMLTAIPNSHSLVEQGRVYDEYDADPATLAAGAAESIWQAMIDAALK